MAQASAAIEQVVQFPYKRAMRPIDLVHLAKQCLGDEHLEYEILRLFDTTMQTYFGRLMQAIKPEELAMSLHAIKGASGGVGAWTIAELAKTAEAELAASGEVTPELIADIGVAIEEVRTFITRVLGNEPA